MSLETVELWRPRRDPGQRARHRLATALVLALLVGSIGAAVMLRRPLVLLLGFATALVFAFAIRWLPGGAAGPPPWVVLLPRRWVPRLPGDRRGAPRPERRVAARDSAATPATTLAPCNPQRTPRTVALGGPPRV